jgi:hypothetical protein
MELDILISHLGQKLPIDPLMLSRRLGLPPSPRLIEHAVRKLGFLRMRSIQNSLLIEFDSAKLGHLAAFSAFYEIKERAPRRVALIQPERGSELKRYEVLPSAGEAMRRIERVALKALGRSRNENLHSISEVQMASACEGSEEAPLPPLGDGKVISFRDSSGVATRIFGADCSRRIHPPVDTISANDDWLAHVYKTWRGARPHRGVPSIESINFRNLPGVGNGRAHLLDAKSVDPRNYLFLLWGKANSYRAGGDLLTLGRMPFGPMREAALEDYSRAAATGAPEYTLISVTEAHQKYSYARLILPLCDGDARATLLLVLINERDLANDAPALDRSPKRTG